MNTKDKVKFHCPLCGGKADTADVQWNGTDMGRTILVFLECPTCPTHIGSQVEVPDEPPYIDLID